MKADKKKSGRRAAEALGEPRQGRVIRNTGSSYTVRFDSDNSLADCRIKGNFRLKGIRTTNPVAVGDRVMVAPADSDTLYITQILPRQNYIIRRASNLSKESHILAANIDLAILVATLRDPATPLIFIDRFLATCEAYDVKAALVINKSDLWDELDAELAEGMRHLYTGLGYEFLTVSAARGEGIDRLRDLTRDKVSLLAGNSGVGKSSLINVLVPDANLRTGKISDIHHTGMHTTTFSEMIPLPYGGEIIDIPGVKGFGTIDFAPEEVSHFFPEIFSTGSGCRYADCSHTGEPGCAVIPAVEQHRISQSRYASYLNILEESREAEGGDKYRKPF